MADMQELIARLEAAEVGHLAIIEPDIHLALFGTSLGRAARCPAYLRSLDAALALAERVLPLWCAVSEWSPRSNHPSGNNACASVHLLGGGGGDRVAAPTPALALCIAILKAKAQGEGRHD